MDSENNNQVEGQVTGAVQQEQVQSENTDSSNVTMTEEPKETTVDDKMANAVLDDSPAPTMTLGHMPNYTVPPKNADGSIGTKPTNKTNPKLIIALIIAVIVGAIYLVLTMTGVIGS